MARPWPFLLLTVGLLLIVAGFSYDLAFAGIPDQDPTPEMSARYRRHSRIAGAVRAAGGVACLIGAAGAGSRFLSRRRGSIRPLMVWLVLMTAAIGARGQSVVLNEVMALNETGIEDEDGDRPDWIELFNPGTAAINLAGYGLSDDRSLPFKWVFPRVILPSRGYLLVFASGKDRTNAVARLHANFSVRASGERVGLTRPDRVLVSELPGRPVVRDVSLGRAPNGGTNLVFFALPTPGTANPPSGASGIVAAPDVAERSGFRPGPFLLPPPGPGRERKMGTTVVDRARGQSLRRQCGAAHRRAPPGLRGRCAGLHLEVQSRDIPHRNTSAGRAGSVAGLFR